MGYLREIITDGHPTLRKVAKRVTPREIEHAILLATTSIGFPAVVAALSWAGDIIGKAGKPAKKRKG